MKNTFTASTVTTTQAEYTADIVRLLNSMPENETAGKLVRRIWKLLIMFFVP